MEENYLESCPSFRVHSAQVPALLRVLVHYKLYIDVEILKDAIRNGYRLEFSENGHMIDTLAYFMRDQVAILRAKYFLRV